MIGSLVKQLFPALGRFIAYHATRPFRKLPPSIPEPSGAEPAFVAQKRQVDSPEAMPETRATDASLWELGLDPKYLELTRWPTFRDDTPPDYVLSDSLYALWTSTRGGHKWSQYFEAYRQVLEVHRHAPVRLLEIGVNNGAGLQLWRQYFDHPDTCVVGIDIQEMCAQFDMPSKGVNVRIGSQADAEFLSKLVTEFGKFDIIIDDGSHMSSHMITSFNCLFLDGLKDPGIYIVEDLHASYWSSWRDTRRTFLDFAKELMEYMHAQYLIATPKDLFIEKLSDQPLHSVEVPLITTMIKEIRCFDSMVAIYKSHRAHMPFGLYASKWPSSFFDP